jgi:hypothetical protein
MLAMRKDGLSRTCLDGLIVNYTKAYAHMSTTPVFTRYHRAFCDLRRKTIDSAVGQQPCLVQSIRLETFVIVITK